MATITLGGDLAYFFFEIVQAVDRGADAPLEEAHVAAIDGYTVELVERYYEADLSLLDEADRDAINAAYQAHAPRPDKLGFQTNGLAYLAGVAFTIIRFGEWRDPDTGATPDMDSLELEM